MTEFAKAPEPGVDVPPARNGAGRPRRSTNALSADERQQLGARAATLYGQLRSIRAVAKRLDRSYGFVHGLLTEAGVQMLPSGARPSARPS